MDDLSFSPSFFVVRCSRTLVPFTRSHVSAGHMVVCVVTDQIVGDRHRFLVPPTGPEHRDGSFFLCIVTGSIVFWDFGSLYPKASRRPSGQLLRQRPSITTKTLRRPGRRLLRQRPTQPYLRSGVTGPAVAAAASAQ